MLFGKSGNNSLNARLTGAVLTLAPTITVRGSSGTLGAASGTDTIINQGTISADDSGGQPVRLPTTPTSPAAARRPRLSRSTPAGSPIRRRRWFTKRCANGNFTYTLPGLTAGNSYTLRLHFAELSATAAGQRKFNVSVNGTAVLTNFDIFATAGASNKAVVQTFTATADANGQITVSFTSVTRKRQPVNGLELFSGTTPVLAINAGLLAGGTITINPTTFTNQGTLQASNGCDALDQWRLDECRHHYGQCGHVKPGGSIFQFNQHLDQHRHDYRHAQHGEFGRYLHEGATGNL